MTVEYGYVFRVSDYVSAARVLLQDTVDSPYRYPDIDLFAALNFGLMEAKKLRPDLFVATQLPLYPGVADPNAIVPMDPMYQLALVYFICGHVQLRDNEEVQDQRAAAFLGLFTAKLGTFS